MERSRAAAEARAQRLQGQNASQSGRIAELETRLRELRVADGAASMQADDDPAQANTRGADDQTTRELESECAALKAKLARGKRQFQVS